MRPLLGSLSVRGKLVAMILLTTLVSLASAFGFAIVHDVKTVKRDLVDGTLLVARVVADASVTDLTFGDRKEAGHTLARLAVVPNARFAYLFDRHGRPFASYLAARERPTPSASAPPVAAGNALFRGGLLHVVEPVQFQGESYGTIWVGVSTRELDRKIRGWITSAVVAMAVLAGLSLLVAWRLQRLVTVPLRALADGARRVSAEHDYSLRVAKSADDEIGTLTDDFNEMLGEIQRREQERDRADRRSHEKSLFLAHMSHELRTPLNSIIGFSRILLTHPEPEIAPRRRHFLENIRSSGEHLLAIIDNVLDLSKVEAGRMRLSPETLSFPEVLVEVFAVMREIAESRRILLRETLPPGLPTLEADPVLLRQILINLLSNAAKFSPDGSCVTVSARAVPGDEKQPEGIEFAVRDEGIGIDAADFDLIFERFRQVDDSAGRRFQGAGLGLSLVKSYVQLHHGTIHVQSAPGKGATFVVRLPLRHETTAPGNRG